MSIPQHFEIVVISNRYPRGGEIASTASGILTKGYEKLKYFPFIAGTSAHYLCRKELTIAGINRGLIIGNSVQVYLLNPKTINLWIALDDEGKEISQKIISLYGEPSNEFYRRVFPKLIESCGFIIEEPPESGIEKWIEKYEILLSNWKKKILDAFYESS